MKFTSLEHSNESAIFREEDGTITISVPIKIRKYSGRQQIVMPTNISYNDFKEKQALTVLQTALARARRWQKMLDSGQYRSMREIAAAEDVDTGYVSRIMFMNRLSPEIVRKILDDDIESNFSFNDIYREIPVLWPEQSKQINTVTALH